MEVNRNIVLTGFMGTGKSSVGRRLASRLGYRFVDTDTLIVEKAGLPIKEIFEQSGEPRFRELEREAIENISRESGLVIATGGGVVLDDINMSNLRNNGVIVCLTATPEVIMERTQGRNDRPLLNTSEREQRVLELLEFRRPFYERSDLTVDTSSMRVDEVIKVILDFVKTWHRDGTEMTWNR